MLPSDFLISLEHAAWRVAVEVSKQKMFGVFQHELAFKYTLSPPL